MMETIIKHYRYNQDGKLKRYRRGRESWEPNPKGGKTEVMIWRAGKVYIGIADCSKGDNFCYRTGRWIATYRAVIQLPYYEAIEWPGFNFLRLYVSNGNKFAQNTATILLLEEEKEERERLAKELVKIASFMAYIKEQADDYNRAMAMMA